MKILPAEFTDLSDILALQRQAYQHRIGQSHP